MAIEVRYLFLAPKLLFCRSKRSKALTGRGRKKDKGKLFNNLAADDSFQSTGMNGDPDVGRGCFVMEYKKKDNPDGADEYSDIVFVMWVGEEDHLRLSAIQTTDNSYTLYQFFVQVVEAIQAKVRKGRARVSLRC